MIYGAPRCARSAHVVQMVALSNLRFRATTEYNVLQSDPVYHKTVEKTW